MPFILMVIFSLMLLTGSEDFLD